MEEKTVMCAVVEFDGYILQKKSGDGYYGYPEDGTILLFNSIKKAENYKYHLDGDDSWEIVKYGLFKLS